MFDADGHEAFVQNFWEPFFLNCDANNLLSQLSTWFDGDCAGILVSGLRWLSTDAGSSETAMVFPW
jgi:hypothetical protein